MRDTERAIQKSWSTSRAIPKRQVQRAKIISPAAAGRAYYDVGARLGCSPSRDLDEAGGRGPPFTRIVQDVTGVVIATLRRPPEGSTRCRIRTLAAELGGGLSTAQRISREYRLRLRRVKIYKDGTAPVLEEKVTDIVGLYLHPPEDALVLPVHAKTKIHALDRRLLVAIKPGQAERHSHDFVGHGTTDLDHSSWSSTTHRPTKPRTSGAS